MNRKVSRLKRKVAYDDSNPRPCGIYFKDSWKWVENDPITKETYHTNINREWTYEKPLDNMEWRLLSN